MQTSYGIIMDIVNQKDPYERLWTTAMSFSNYYDKWMNGPILNVNAEVVDEEVCIFIGGFTLTRKNEGLKTKNELIVFVKFFQISCLIDYLIVLAFLIEVFFLAPGPAAVEEQLPSHQNLRPPRLHWSDEGGRLHQGQTGKVQGQHAPAAGTWKPRSQGQTLGTDDQKGKTHFTE